MKHWAKKVKSIRWLDDAFQKRISLSFIDRLPRILSVVMTVMVLISTLRLYVGGQHFLTVASRRELAMLTETADPERPLKARDDGVERPEDCLGNSMGYELSASEHYSFGRIVTADGTVVYSLDAGAAQKDSPFYNLVKDDETDRNRYRMLPEQYRHTLVHAYNPITGVHAGRGSNVVLTIPYSVQSAVYNYMGKHNIDGTCVAFEPKTGAVTCLVSNNAARDWYRINENLGTSRPASTFKVLLCALLEEQGVDTSALHYSCQGTYRLKDGEEIRCAGKKAHGAKMSTEDALGVSCNCFFAQAIEEHLNWDQTAELMQGLGIQVNGAGKGEHRLGQLERNGSTAALSGGEKLFSDVWSLLGEGKTSTSPVDMVQWCAAIVNEGSVVEPCLVKAERRDKVRYFGVSTAQRVYEQWKSAYENNYDHKIYSDLITVAKTGTDQVDSKGNEAYTLVGYSEELDTAFYIRINNAVTQDGKNKLKKRPVDVAKVLLRSIQGQQ